MSAKREQHASKGSRRSQKGAKMIAIGHAMKKRRMSPLITSTSNERINDNGK